MIGQFAVIMFDARYPPPVVGGKEKQAHLLAVALRTLGVDVRALTFRYAVHDPVDLVVDGVPIHRVSGGGLRFARLARWLFAQRRSCRILHIHTPSRIGVLLGILAKLLRYKVVFKLPNVGLLDRRGPAINRLRRAIVPSFDGVVALEDDTARELRALGLRDAAILEMNNGVEMSTTSAGVGSDRDDARVRLVFVGRLVKQKRCTDVLHACARLRSGSSQWSLAVIGDGPLRENLESEAGRLGLGEPALEFLGFRADAIALIAQADIVVVASEIEGMPNVVLEAMSAAVPVVATDVGGIPRMLGEVGRPYTFSVGDVARLAELLGRLISDAEERRAYGNALRQRCETHYRIDSVARAYLEAYGRLQ